MKIPFLVNSRPSAASSAAPLADAGASTGRPPEARVPIESAAPVPAVPDVPVGRCTGLVERVLLERRALLDLVGAQEELAQARNSAMTRGTSVEDALRARFDDLRNLRERTIFELRDAQKKQYERGRAAAPLVAAAVAERERLARSIAETRNSIARYDAAREDFRARLLDAGLSHEEIAHVDLKPAPADLARWKASLEAAQARDDALLAKIKGGAEAFLGEAEQCQA